MAQVEFARYPDGDSYEGYESVIVDAVELSRWEGDNPPVWIAPVRDLFAQRDQIAEEAMAKSKIVQ